MIGNPRPSPFYPGTNNRRSVGSVGKLIVRSINWGIVVGFLIVFGFFGWILWQGQPQTRALGTVGFVVVGWVFSLCLHEFGHAVTAVLGGDTSPGTIRYLSFNPLHYVHPLMSIIMPIVFLILGGIPLPGGAVYLRRDLIRNRFWQSAVSLAGPMGNLLFLLGLALVWRSGLIDAHPDLVDAISVLAFFQVFAIVLNLLPIPPLDGYGAIEPYLSHQTAAMMRSFGWYGMLLLFALFWYVPVFNRLYFSVVGALLVRLHIDLFLVGAGFAAFQFWQR